MKQPPIEEEKIINSNLWQKEMTNKFINNLEKDAEFMWELISASPPTVKLLKVQHLIKLQ